MPPRSFALLLAVSAGFSLGCGRVREISACRTLAHEVNPALDRIAALSKSADGARLTRMASEYSELAKRLKPQASGKGALASAVRDYTAILESTAGALRSHAQLGSSGSPARAGESSRELERLVKRERAAVARIEAECHS